MVAIEDPLDPNNNVGRSCHRIYEVMQAFRQRYTFLCYLASQKNVLVSILLF